MPTTNRLDNLDLVRGLAAILVLADHLRGFLFLPFSELAKTGMDIGLLTKAYYFLTHLGHPAVIVFFALSGYLVGGKAFEDLIADKFSWSTYMVRRLTRLWIVIIPLLLLTLLFDKIGMTLPHGDIYQSIHHDDLGASVPVDHRLATFIGNLLFLQTIAYPNFGSLAPIWSLANEFWYYVTIPLAAWLVMARTSITGRIAGLALLLVLSRMLPISILTGGLVWIAGAAVAWMTRRHLLESTLSSHIARFGGLALFLTALALTQVASYRLSLLSFGLIVAIVLPVLVYLPSPGGIYASASHAMSEISFTLYLSHFPLITLLIATGLVPDALPPSPFAFMEFGAVAAISLVWAGVLWCCFERNTTTAYRAIIARLGSGQTSITPGRP